MHTSKYFISIVFLLFFVNGFSQDKNKSAIQKDTIIYTTNYGLRLGADISKPIISMLDASYMGFEILGDYRINKNWYAAAEFGFEEQTTEEDYTNSTAKGSFIKLGVNINTYNNWMDMNNEVYLGLRYGFSLFEQTLNSYTPNVGNTYFPANTITTPQTTTGLTAHWTEFALGMKVETFKNLFVSINASFNILLSVKDPENFKSLYAPGFNRIYHSNTGFGFNYGISYLIPFQKK